MLIRDLVVISVTFTFIKGSFNSAQGLWWGDKNCCLKVSKIISTNFILKALTKLPKLETLGFGENSLITAVTKQTHVLDKLTVQIWPLRSHQREVEKYYHTISDITINLVS